LCPDFSTEQLSAIERQSSVMQLTRGHRFWIRRTEAHCLSSEDAVRIRDQRARVECATYRFDAQRGSLQPIQILPSTLADYTGNNHGAEIAVAPSGRAVYASNRGDDSIGIFDVDQRSGTLTPVGWAQTHAKSPRFFASIRQPKSFMRPTPTRALAISRTPTRSSRSRSTKRTGC
jgi:hypothetical protein